MKKILWKGSEINKNPPTKWVEIKKNWRWSGMTGEWGNAGRNTLEIYMGVIICQRVKLKLML